MQHRYFVAKEQYDLCRTGDMSAIKVVKLEPGDNFTVIQQEILMMRDCVHQNIIAYHGSYLRLV